MVAYQFPQDFLEKLDSGAFDRTLRTELQKLPHEQLEQVAHILAERTFRALGLRIPATAGISQVSRQRAAVAGVATR